MHRKTAGIQHDARQQRLGFQLSDVVLGGHELQQFTHQLAGAGSKGFMIQKDRVINMPYRHAVMVDNNHAAAFFVNLLVFQQALLVCIGYD